jgi:hypothetical protein
MNYQKNQKLFCLGGHDLEMLTIKQLLEENAQPVLDKQLNWGAAASAYSSEIEHALQQNITPVLIELQNDLKRNTEQIIFIDHHGSEAGEDQPTALHQVFELLCLPVQQWTRWFELVAANDRGYIPALQALKTSQAEIIQVRQADRCAQGISFADEIAAQEAIATMEIKADGALNVVYLNHSRTTAVVDALHPALGGVGYQNCLVVSLQELNFFGDGQCVQALAQAFPDSWYGGSLPTRGFWGSQCVETKKVIDFLVNTILRMLSLQRDSIRLF